MESKHWVIKLLGAHVWLEVNNEVLRTKHIAVSVFYGWNMYG